MFVLNKDLQYIKIHTWMTKGIKKKYCCFGQLDSIDLKIIVCFSQTEKYELKKGTIVFIYISDKLNFVYCLEY